MNCQSCNQPISEGTTFCTSCGSPVDRLENIEGKQYKVISQRDEVFSGGTRFNSNQIQKVLNQHAASGWRLISVCSVDNFMVWTGERYDAFTSSSALIYGNDVDSGHTVVMFLERG
tara:strand:+ start:468 stop:815 length:348 start_codon:yes stop_codon:yes gene_type:complete